jgi:hypothetical protein
MTLRGNKTEPGLSEALKDMDEGEKLDTIMYYIESAQPTKELKKVLKANKGLIRRYQRSYKTL